MQSAVDVDERFAVAGELTRVAVAQSLRMRESPGNLTVAIDLRQVVRTRDEREILCPALTRLAGLEHLHVLRRRRDFLEIVDRLIVGGELEVRARPESKNGVGRGHAALSDEDDRRRQQQQ